MDRAASKIQARHRGRLARRRGAPMAPYAGLNSMGAGFGGGGYGNGRAHIDSDWAKRFLGRLGPNGKRVTRVQRHTIPAREYLRAEMVPALKTAFRETSAARASLLRRNGAWGAGTEATLQGENVAMWAGDRGDPVWHVSRALRLMVDPDLESREAAQRAFDKLDQDGDGTISIEELGDALSTARPGTGTSYKELRTLVDAADADQNGRVSFGEFLAMVKQIKAAKPQNGETQAPEDGDGTGAGWAAVAGEGAASLAAATKVDGSAAAAAGGGGGKGVVHGSLADDVRHTFELVRLPSF